MRKARTMQRSNIVTNSLAVLTLAALALPATSQVIGGYRPAVRPSVRYQNNPAISTFGWNSFNGINFGWNNPPVFFGNNSGAYLPPSGEYYAPSEDYYQPSDAEANTNQNTSNVLPRTSDAIQIDKDRTKVTFSWQGEPNAVRRITFALLDRAKQPIRQQVITRLPAEARLTRNGRTAYYQVKVEYLNGTTNNIIAPL